MNNSILKKCLDELNKETPRKDYVIGMIETLIETGGANQIRDFPQAGMAVQTPYIIPDMNQFPVIDPQQAELAHAYGIGPVAQI